MTFWNWVSLAYLVVGLLLAAVVYHAMSGGLDDRFTGEPHDCEDCGVTHEPTETERELAYHLDVARTMRGHESGRVAIAVSTALFCLTMALAWPAVMTWIVAKAVQDAKTRR